MKLAEFIQQRGAPLALAKHEIVFYQGDLDDSLYFVVAGLLKAYYVSPDGKESIKSFIRAGSIIGSLSAAHQGLPCTFSLMALEQSRLLRIPFAQLLQATHESHTIAEEVIQKLLGLYLRKEQREYDFLSLSAEERYLNICNNEPELIEKLTQNDIARYLGITPVALSRIKKRLSSISTPKTSTAD